MPSLPLSREVNRDAIQPPPAVGGRSERHRDGVGQRRKCARGIPELAQRISKKTNGTQILWFSGSIVGALVARFGKRLLQRFALLGSDLLPPEVEGQLVDLAGEAERQLIAV